MNTRTYGVGTTVKNLDGFSKHKMQCGEVIKPTFFGYYLILFDDGEEELISGENLRVARREEVS